MKSEVKRDYKSSIFSMLLADKGYALQVYNALNHTAYQEPEALTIVRLDNAVYVSYRNDASFVLAGQLNLYEHQSTINPNMPLRDLIYVSNMLADIVKNENLYGTKLVRIPRPRFVVFYNGEVDRPDIEGLKLSEAYIESECESEPELELVCTVININVGQSKELLDRCPVLREYSTYVDKVRQYKRGMDVEKAVDMAIDECIEEGVLKDFLMMQRAEAKNMSVLEFNLERQLKFERLEGREEGREEVIKALQLIKSEDCTSADDLIAKGIDEKVAKLAVSLLL